MFVLIGELNFWTFDNDVDIKETDFGAFSYHEKKMDSVYEEGKKSYAQKREMVYVPQNKKGYKMKDSIKFLTEQLKDHSTIYCQWSDYCTMQIMLSSGLLIYVQVDLCSGDVKKIVFDKYLVGKSSERLSDVIITKNYLICTYNDCQITLVNFLKPKKSIFEKISRLEPKLSTFDICGPAGRRLEKKIQHNKTEDLVLIWWKSTMNEVYPWSPTVKEHDRANVHLYRLTGTKLELLCYLRTEFDPLSIIFNNNYDNVIHSLEQKVSRKGEVTVEWRTYEVSRNDKLQRIAVVSIPLPTHTSCIRFSPNQEMLLLCCIDGSMTLHDQVRSTNISIKAAFIPTLACWHSDGNIFAIGNERGQVQHFDIALNCVKSQTLTEDVAPANIIDLSSYFRTQPALIRLEWSTKSELNSFVNYYNHGDTLFLLLFERGPIAIMKVVEAANISGDTVVQKYLSSGQVQQATSFLLAMNWDSNSHACMHSLNQIVNHLFKQPLTPERENHIQNALGSFHVPVKPLCQSVIDEYGDEVRDLTRRFFHHLLRYRLFEKAFRLAIDLNDHDLFMDIHFYAIVLKDSEMAIAAKEKAEEIISRCNSCSSSHSTCSRSSCSLCSDSASEKDEYYTEDTESEESPKKEKVHTKRSSKHKYPKQPNSQVPPLPVLYPQIYNTGFISTPFNEITDKIETNLMSTPFNIPNSSIPQNSYNYTTSNFFPNSVLTSVPYTKSTLSPLTSLNYIQSMRSYDNLISPFQNLSVANKLTPSVAQSSLNSMSLENITNSYQMGNFMSSALNGASFEPKSIDVPSNSTQPSMCNVSSNIMLTPFNNPFINTDNTSQNDTYVGANIDSDDKRLSGLTVLKTNKTNPHPTNSLNPVQSDDSVITVKPIISTCNDPPPLSLFNSATNLMSTSFNDLDPNDDTNTNSCDGSTNSNSISNHSALNIPPPPPPLITDSLANYIHNLPKKNYVLSRSTPGLTELDNLVPKLQHVKPLHTAPSLLPQQNSVSNILQTHHKNNSFQSTCKYRLDYDLDYIPFHNSCDNLTNLHSNISHIKSNSYNIPTKSFDNKHLRGIGFSQSSTNLNKEHRLSSNVPPLPVINTPNSNEKTSSPPISTTDISSTTTEKPKVKFSDTVTHILVPNSGPTYRPLQKRAGPQLHSMDPKRELADSLPLCLGNEDYLKNFQPLSKEECDKEKEITKTEETAKIKVVHFGLL